MVLICTCSDYCEEPLGSMVLPAGQNLHCLRRQGPTSLRSVARDFRRSLEVAVSVVLICLDSFFFVLPPFFCMVRQNLRAMQKISIAIV